MQSTKKLCYVWIKVWKVILGILMHNYEFRYTNEGGKIVDLKVKILLNSKLTLIEICT